MLAAVASLEGQSWVTLGSLLQERLLPVPGGKKVVMSILILPKGAGVLLPCGAQLSQELMSFELRSISFTTPYVPGTATHHLVGHTWH